MVGSSVESQMPCLRIRRSQAASWALALTYWGLRVVWALVDGEPERPRTRAFVRNLARGVDGVASRWLSHLRRR